MPSITTQKDARRVRDLPFCYICGRDFAAGDAINHDHVPPEAIFATVNRNFPLKLAAHEECHAPQNLDDEVMGQLVSPLHGKNPAVSNDQLKIEIYQRTDTSAYLAVFSRRNLEFLLRRWLTGFHAALYGEPLLDGARFAIQTPFPSGTLGSIGFAEDPIHLQHFKFVECVKRNRLTRSLDCIVTNNQKLQYECVWDRLSDGSAVCVFALDIYGWKDLGDVNNFPARGCAGLYRPASGKPPSHCSKATELNFQFENVDALDPFEA